MSKVTIECDTHLEAEELFHYANLGRATSLALEELDKRYNLKDTFSKEVVYDLFRDNGVVVDFQSLLGEKK